MSTTEDTNAPVPDQHLLRMKVWSQRTWVAHCDDHLSGATLEARLAEFLQEAFEYAHTKPELLDKPTAQIAEAVMAGILHSETVPSDALQAALHKITS
ncbi:MAG: hypothetical protein JJ868_13545 [Shimia sp.]|uniref:hypothetical protein n=1 Tax=Shimia sp. TaxID=1954381 RepID=UPI0019FEC59F|nr:hypothetical protein [Shimia sp.]MBE1294296.1 hypothetical protein [Paracoccaceae bacterium]MBO6898392.1 hypothetical protein [Shimia sp.]